MPIMDGRGHVLCGGGGLQGSLDGTPLPFATYGGGCWYDDRGTALEQLREPAPGTLAFCREAAAPALLPRGANDFAGGGGAFIAWLAGYGVWGSLEQRLAGTDEEVRAHLATAGTAGPRSVAPDGTIAYIPDRQNGYGLALVDPDGRAVIIPGIPPVDVQVLGAGVAIWRGGAEGRPPTRPALADAQGVQLQTFDGEDWLLYWSEARGCILQPDRGTHGFVLDSRPLEFNPHMRVVDNELRICWSTTQGEGPNRPGGLRTERRPRDHLSARGGRRAPTTAAVARSLGRRHAAADRSPGETSGRAARRAARRTANRAAADGTAAGPAATSQGRRHGLHRSAHRHLASRTLRGNR